MCDGDTDLDLVEIFPNLINCVFAITSPKSTSYNCFAWANGDNDCWWWPTDFSYWPSRAPRKLTLDAFIKAYEAVGFQLCDNCDYEENYVKIAIFVDSNGRPAHAARQLDSKFWTSKLGDEEDIMHELYGLEGDEYGRVQQFLKRPQPGK
jgi:hypothetical protein